MGHTHQAAWQPVGAMAAMMEPRVEAARRVLARQAFPVGARVDLVPDPGGGPGLDLLAQLLRDEDFPLLDLRHGLQQLERRLRDRSLVPPPHDAASVEPEDLGGQGPVDRATRAVYRRLRRRGRAVGLRRDIARREAREQALRFRELCRLWLPDQQYRGPGALAALHAWAQCYAREFVDASTPCGPSATCDEAARIGQRMAALAERGELRLERRTHLAAG